MINKTYVDSNDNIWMSRIVMKNNDFSSNDNVRIKLYCAATKERFYFNNDENGIKQRDEIVKIKNLEELTGDV